MAEHERSKRKQNPDAETSRPAFADGAQAGPERGVLLTPGERIASHWNGALRARLNRQPLEAFLRSHKHLCELSTTQAVTENLVRACMIMVQPVLPHRGAGWPALTNPGYFDAIGEGVSRITRALAELIEEPQLWRVSSLVGVARLLTPNLGIDMAAAAAASAVAGALCGRHPAFFEDTLGIHATIAVNSVNEGDLDAVRTLLMRGLAGGVENGASSNLTAPSLTPICLTTIWVAPPSNH